MYLEVHKTYVLGVLQAMYEELKSDATDMKGFCPTCLVRITHPRGQLSDFALSKNQKPNCTYSLACRSASHCVPSTARVAANACTEWTTTALGSTTALASTTKSISIY
jgi:hypothetical protein